MAIDENTKQKILVIFPKTLLEKVEDYRFDNRMPSRNAAIIELIEKGLASMNKDKSL